MSLNKELNQTKPFMTHFCRGPSFINTEFNAEIVFFAYHLIPDEANRIIKKKTLLVAQYISWTWLKS